ncbi:MAG: 50S ribosomal protein L23 [Chloroflexi bacterium]|nr:50S ribosomal protein L23 [Chloroflexota bacterium]
MHTWEILRRPIVTEKSTLLGEVGKYVFEVNKKAGKPQIKRAVEVAFNVSVVSVNTLKVPGKTKRYGPRMTTTPAWKKAIVTLRSGDTIQLFEGA